ncbi:chloride channel CLIC-like protein 1 isoform X2 [Ctenopharyngodon idella]|uniref:chloride channel CLIC-like protein 1 isoform X2 n=2 Tax=Ctenopharyngodon idella TaxID=7959 RepID=UPI00222E7B74|nr:chloride channel CLIC-like protein 1 isoform X2 [Ctenopharyngodon idella]XP_051764399.1 chloride channel CLIC-like protein 1 isoform X2 [Ctenopharyngodon idella]
MKVPRGSSFGFCSFLIFCSLFDIANTNIHQEDDAWIDPYDMLNYDPTTKRMRKPTESASYQNVPTKRRGYSSESCDVPQSDASECINKLEVLQKELDEHKKKGTATSSKPVCLPVFKRFLSKLLKETSKLGLPDDETTAMHYDAEVKLSKQSLAEIQKLLNEQNDWTTGAMDEALSQILVKFKHHNHEAWKWRFEDTFHVEVDTVLKVFLIVLIVVAIICTELWFVVSWMVQFRRMFAVCFFISLIWNWFHLYMLAFADHKKKIVEVESFNGQCTGLSQLDWKDSLSAWYRRTWTLQDDPCKRYYEVLVVNPILLVPPTKAITVTIASFITDPLKQIGEGISEFLRALLKDLPVTLQIPVLLTITAAICVFMYGSAQAAVYQAVRLPRLGWRQDPPPPAVGQRQAPQLREHEDVWEGGDAPQPLQIRQGNGNRVNQAGNRGDQVFRAGDANAPQNRQVDRSMELQQEFAETPRGTQRVRVETVHPAGNMSSDDETDFQLRTQEVDPGTKENAEPEVKVEEKEKNASTVDKKEQKDTQSPDGSEPVTNVPPPQIDVKTLGANQGNEHFMCTKRIWAARNDLKLQGASADVAAGEEVYSSFRKPVQESGL